MIPDKPLTLIPLLLASGALMVNIGAASAQSPPKPAPPAANKMPAPRNRSIATEPKPALEPKAIEVLKASSNRLAAAHSLSFRAVEIFEQPSRHGHPLAYATKSDVTLRRPDGLRVIISGDGPASEFYYDGKIMMAFAPAENLLAVADAPPTIDATLDAAYHSAGIYFPFTDLIVADPYKDMAQGLKLAYYIGQSQVVGGTTTDIVAYIDNDVFVQLWIGAEDKLPRMLHAVFLNDPEHLRHQLELSNWQLDVAVPMEAFATSSASSAKRIPFAHPHPQPAPGAKPPSKARPAKAQPQGS
jgi:hypothetical protein